MTPWNAANDFMKSRSGLRRTPAAVRARPVGLLRSCPHRRSVAGTTGRTDLEVGYAGRGGAVGLPSRNPIGFAPAADPERDLPGEPRFHTEISFKRHQAAGLAPRELPSGNGSGDESEPGSADLVWKLPATETDDRGRVEETPPKCSRRPPRTAGPRRSRRLTTSLPRRSPRWSKSGRRHRRADGSEKVPFYKRELSFRRRKPERESRPSSRRRGGARRATRP